MPKYIKKNEYNLIRSFEGTLLNRYSPEAADRLVLWTKMDTTPLNLVPNQLSVSYYNSPTGGVSQILAPGDTLRETVTFSDAADTHAVVAADALLSHSSLGNLGTPTSTSDRAFSISMWINFSILSTNDQYLFWKGIEYHAQWYDSAMGIRFFIKDDSAGVNLQYVGTVANPALIPLTINNWNHLVFTYDGRGGTSASAGMKIYINGVDKSDSRGGAGTYVGMIPDHSDPLRIGAGYGDGLNGDDEIDGQVSEFAMWSNHVLTQAEITAIYTRTRYGPYRSGITNNPPRVLLHELDDALGRYPTIARTGDPDFLGKFPIHFDDNRTLIFSSSQFNQTLVYPGLLPSHRTEGGSSPIIATPNTTSSISLNAGMRAGISDSLLDYNQNNIFSQSLSPFNDSRVYFSGTDFYLTGTSLDVMRGFSAPLRDKTILSFNLGVSEPSSIFYSTGTQPDASGLSGGVNSGMAYFNFNDRRWEIVGDLTTGSMVDSVNPMNLTITSSMLGFQAPDMSDGLVGPGVDLVKMGGVPVSSFGFPFAQKFAATGSQFLKMSDHITHPFLLEKVVLEFSASFPSSYSLKEQKYIDPGATENVPYGPQTFSFFLLNSFDNTSLTTTAEFTATECPNLTGLEPSFAPPVEFKTLYTGSYQEIVTWGTVGLHPNRTFTGDDITINKRGLPEPFMRDLNLFPGQEATSGDGRYFIKQQTGSFRIGFPARMPTKTPGATIFQLGTGSATGHWVYASKLPRVRAKWAGSRHALLPENLSSGRSYTKTVPGFDPMDTRVKVEGTNARPLPLIPPTSASVGSPYVLLPTDRLILGFENTRNWSRTAQNGYTNASPARNEDAVSKQVVTFGPGEFKMTFFGSLMRDSIEYHEVSNQPLTSNAIHEALHSDNPVVDQFDVEPFQQLSGSWNDDVFAGSMAVSPQVNDPIAAGARGIVGRCTEGTQGVTGSLLRGVRILETNLRYYDSLVPNPVEAYFQDGGQLANKSGVVGLAFAMPGWHANASTLYQDAIVAPQFLAKAAVPYQSFSEIDRIKKINNSAFRAPALQTDEPSLVQSTANPTALFVTGAVGTMTNAYHTTRYSEFEEPQSTQFDAQKYIKVLFGRGDGEGNTPFTITGGEFVDAVVRGWGYGLKCALPQSPSMVFRRTRYGQLRDMLEQRHDTRYFDSIKSRLNISPIVIKFVDQRNNLIPPAQTTSQNLSQFMTSSQPYYDGKAVDRDGFGDNVVIIDVAG